MNFLKTGLQFFLKIYQMFWPAGSTALLEVSLYGHFQATEGAYQMQNWEQMFKISSGGSAGRLQNITGHDPHTQQLFEGLPYF